MTGGCASPAVCGRTAVCLLQLEESIHSWGLRACVCVCLGKQQWLGRGLWERAIKTNAVPPVMQVDGAGRLPLANRHLVKVTFPKKAMTHGTPSPPGLCYSTGKRANGLALDISVWGGWGMKAVVCGVGPLSVEVNLFFFNLCMPLLLCFLFSSSSSTSLSQASPHTNTHVPAHTPLSVCWHFPLSSLLSEDERVPVCLALWLCLMAKLRRQAADRPCARAEYANRGDLWKYALCHFLSISLTTSLCQKAYEWVHG